MDALVKLCLLAFLPLQLVTCLPAQLPFTNCSSPNTIPNSPIQLGVDTVYGQIITQSSTNKRFLDITLFGSTPDEIVGVSNDTHPLLATMFTTTSVLTFTIFTNASAFCDGLRPPSPLPSLGDATNYCPVPAGPIAFSTSSPLEHSYELISLNTRIRVVDASSPPLELLCVDISASPLQPGILNSIYGHASIAFWFSVSITIAYWILVGAARIAAAWRRAVGSTPTTLWSRFQRAGFIIASAVSGERLATSPALLRFCTPSMRDVIYHTQWCAMLGMVAVQWPYFAYPFFAQTAWSTLTYNITLTQGSNPNDEHWNPLRITSFNPPSDYADQVSDPNSPLFLNQSISNSLFNLPPNTRNGMESFAYAIGIRPQDLFGVSVGLFLIIVAGTVVLGLLVWILDWIFSSLSGVMQNKRNLKGTNGTSWSGSAIRPSQGEMSQMEIDEDAAGSPLTPRAPSRALGRVRWSSKYRFGLSSFHRDVLAGNLVRILLLFHLPVTTFSAFQFTRPRTEVTVPSVVLAVLSFVIFSIALPLLLLSRLATMKTNKLYDDTRTLLSLGPLYNQYASGSQTFAKLLFLSNLTLGVVVGCGQNSGTTQSIVILVTEVVSALWTSVYLPWGRGAAMGVVSFLFCVCRIITAVLLVIMSPTVAVGVTAAGWIAIAVLLIQALLYALFLALLFVKMAEAVLRIILRISFDRSRHAVDSGLLGVLSLSGVFGKHGSSNQKYKLARSTTKGSFATQDYSPRPTPSHIPSQIGSLQGPPSVLRPEHVKTPYREDLDDENGHILGAWQPYPDQSVPFQPEPPKSGFSRVRGGRANFETPFAIMTAAGQPFPLSERSVTQSASPGSTKNARPSTPSTTASLPPGALPPNVIPTHARTKSQTAIVVDTGSLQGNETSPVAVTASHDLADQQDTRLLRPLPSDDIDKEDPVASRKKHWFNRRSSAPLEDGKGGSWTFFKGRRRSEGDNEDVERDVEFDPPPDTATSGSSFVVIRDRKPPVPSSGHTQSISTPTDSSTGPSAWRDTEASPSLRPPRSPNRPSTPQ